MRQTVDTIAIDSITFGERYRIDYGDLEELSASLKENGIIQSFAVKVHKGDKPYMLLAGGRRFKAALLAGIEQVPAVIYEENLSPLKVREIELMENIHRKDFHWSEKVKLTKEIHELRVEMYGIKTVGGPGVSGHSRRDTATLLGRSHSSVADDINLAEAMAIIPDMKRFKTRQDAVNFVKKTKQYIQTEKIKNRLEDKEKVVGIESVHKRLIGFYNVEETTTNILESGFFKASMTLKDNIVDMVILDIPYALSTDVQGEISDRSSVEEIGQTWMTITSYIPTLTKFLIESYRLLKQDSWLICWFGPEPWFEPTYQQIISTGFECSRTAGLWVKNKGFAHYPAYHLGNAYEMFFYARKGRPIIHNQDGHTNIFNYNTPHYTTRIHQTEKPIELEQDIMSTFLKANSTILVPCLGSGNSILAAANLDMICWGYDIEEQFKTAFVNNVISSSPPNYKTKQEKHSAT